MLCLVLGLLVVAGAVVFLPSVWFYGSYLLSYFQQEDFVLQGNLFFSGEEVWLGLLNVFFSSLLSKAWQFSLFFASVGALITLILAIFFSVLLEKLPQSWAQWLHFIMLIPFFLPIPVLVVGFYALVSLLHEWGMEGVPSDLFSLAGIFFLCVFLNVGLATSLLWSTLRSIPPSVYYLSHLFQDSPFKRWKLLLVPYLYPTLLQTYLFLVFLYFNSFAVPHILGAGKYHTLLTLGYTLFQQGQLKEALGVLAMQLGFNGVLWGLYSLSFFLAKEKFTIFSLPTQRSFSPTVEIPCSLGISKKLSKALYKGIGAVLGIGFLLPIACLIVRSVQTSTGFSLSFYQNLISSHLFKEVIKQTGGISLGVGLLCFLLGYALIYRFPSRPRSLAVVNICALSPLGYPLLCILLATSLFLDTFSPPAIGLWGFFIPSLFWSLIPFFYQGLATAFVYYPFSQERISTELQQAHHRTLALLRWPYIQKPFFIALFLTISLAISDYTVALALGSSFKTVSLGIMELWSVYAFQEAYALSACLFLFYGIVYGLIKFAEKVLRFPG